MFTYPDCRVGVMASSLFPGGRRSRRSGAGILVPTLSIHPQQDGSISNSRELGTKRSMDTDGREEAFD